MLILQVQVAVALLSVKVAHKRYMLELLVVLG
jgi:hypothetical protein